MTFEFIKEVRVRLAMWSPLHMEQPRRLALSRYVQYIFNRVEELSVDGHYDAADSISTVMMTARMNVARMI